jgi:tRNA(fMet)-specific endonuclease VapC
MVADTDVVSFLFNRDPVRGQRYLPHIHGRKLVLPFAVVGELLFGAEHRNWGPSRRLELERFIRRHQIEYSNYPLCEIWAELRAIARRRGRPLERQDAWVAATSVYLDVTLITHNASDYVGVPGLRVITQPDA